MVEMKEGRSHFVSHQLGQCPYLKLKYISNMHVIFRKTLKAFWEKCPNSQKALTRWFKKPILTTLRI